MKVSFDDVYCPKCYNRATLVTYSNSHYFELECPRCGLSHHGIGVPERLEKYDRQAEKASNRREKAR